MVDSKTGFNEDNGDFIALRQNFPALEVWNIGGSMCIAHDDDPIYITKDQAKKFFNLTENNKND